MVNNPLIYDHVHLLSTKNAPKISIEKLTDFNSIYLSSHDTNIQRAINKAGYSPSTINKIASIVVKHYGEDGFANNVHNELRMANFTTASPCNLIQTVSFNGMLYAILKLSFLTKPLQRNRLL